MQNTISAPTIDLERAARSKHCHEKPNLKEAVDEGQAKIERLKELGN